MTQGEALSILTTGANVFLTGSPGSGKTHTVNAYVKWLRDRGIEPAITASTGIAATHLHGVTIHSWSGIGIAESLTPELLDRVLSKEHVVKRIQRTGVLIIDEISMLSGTTLTMVDQVCRAARNEPRSFGGMQVVFVGDFFQLPPVAGRGVRPPFAFESDAWRAANPLICYLTEQHRHEDPKLLDLLSAVREGTWDESHVSLVTRRATDGDGVEEDVPRLYTHNEDVERLNEEKLARLKTPARTFAMEESGSPVLVEALKRGCLSPETLVLKEGALVMMTKNNPAQGFANGTMGRVVRFERASGYPIVETYSGDEIAVAPMEWAVEEDGKVRAKVTQIPLRLAWAVTIHKSQGQSLDQAAMDLSRVFEHGQGYVALSRVRTLGGVHLLGWSEHAFSVHPDVKELDASLRSASEEAAAVFGALEENGERRAMEEHFVKAMGGSLEKKRAPISTYDATRELIEEGMDVSEIAKKRSLTLGTVADHVEKLLKTGIISKEIALNALPDSLREALPAIHAAFNKKGAEKLAPVHIFLKKNYTYDELKLARSVYGK